VPEVVGLLFPNLPNFIAHVLATIVILIFLSKMVYKPFRKSVDNRRAKIDEELNAVIEKQTEINKNRKASETLLRDAKTESMAIIQTARDDANVQKNEILTAASMEVTNLQNHAKNTIIREQEKAQDEIYQTIVDVAFSAASKILATEIDTKKNKELVDEFIQDLDKKKE
jgi:F-type H+-transporting ATPase subunit b